MILQTLKGKKIVIYGTGHVARKFCKALKSHGLAEQILCFVRTYDVNAGERFEEIPVFCFDALNVDADTVICLAVHESIRDEIEAVVRKKNVQYIWIYPYLYELMFGEPEQREIEVVIRTLLDGFQNDLRLGVRLAAIEQQEGKNEYGFETYVRAQMMYCDRATAEHRLRQFRRLIGEWKQSGCRTDSLLTFNRRFGVIDGNHRLAMAIYTGQERIRGNVYPTDLAVSEIHGQEPMLSADVLGQHGFSVQEIKRLEKIQRRYLQRYECGNRESGA